MFSAFQGSCQALDDRSPTTLTPAPEGATGSGQFRDVNNFDQDGIPHAPMLGSCGMSRKFSGSEIDLTNSSPSNATSCTVLLLGCATFLGTHIVSKLTSAGHAVRGLLRDCPTPAVSRRMADIGRIAETGRSRFTLFNEAIPRDALKDCEAVVISTDPTLSVPNVDAMSADDLRDAYVEATQEIFNSIVTFGKKVRRVVYVGPAAAATQEKDHLMGDAELVPGEFVLAAKVAACIEAQRLSALLGLPTAFLFAAVPLGPLVVSDIPPEGSAAIAAIATGKSWFPFAPNLRWNYVDGRDVAAAVNLAVSEQHTEGQRYVLANGELSFADIGCIVAENFSALDPPLWGLPHHFTAVIIVVQRLMGQRNMSLRYLWRRVGREAPVSGTKAERHLGVKFTPIAKTVVDTVTAVANVEADPDVASQKLTRVRRSWVVLGVSAATLVAGLSAFTAKSFLRGRL